MNRSLLSEMTLQRLTRFLWGAALFTLPVASFRYFPFLGETTYVRPLALVTSACTGNTRITPGGVDSAERNCA